MENLREHLEINPNALDIEWLDQPGLFFELSSALADEKLKLEKLKGAAEIALADEAKEVREDPSKYGLAKVTEAGIKEAVTGSTTNAKWTRRINGQKHSVDILQSAVSACDHKKRALENLVTLHGQQYFSSPKEPRDINTEYLKEAEKKRVRSKGK